MFVRPSSGRRPQAIETALANKIQARQEKREAAAKAAQAEIAEFTAQFLGAAQKCFEMIDKDDSGTLTKAEITRSVSEDEDVIKFLRDCGEPNLQFLLVPARLQKSLEILDTSKDGELDLQEWEDAIRRGLAKRLDDMAEERERRERAAAAADEEFSADFLNKARTTAARSADGSRRRRGGDGDMRTGRGDGDMRTGRGDADAATWIFGRDRRAPQVWSSK